MKSLIQRIFQPQRTLNYRTLSRTTLFLFLLLAGIAPAFAQDAEAALKQFEGKVLVLQHPLRNKSLLYNSNGDLLTTIKDKDAGSWTAYGGIFIENVSVAPDRLVLQGHRMIFMFKNPGILLQELKQKKHSSPISPDVHIEIKLDHAVDSANQAKEIMKNIFALDTADLIKATKGFWNSYLKDHLVYDSSLPQEQEFLWQEPTKKQNAAEQNPLSQTTKDENGEYIAHVGGPVKAPRALYTPSRNIQTLLFPKNIKVF